jgi:hypothetical protein
MLFIGVVLLINGGFFWRNFILCGDPLGPIETRKWGMTYGMNGILVLTNTIRVMLFHLGTRFELWNQVIYQLHNSMYDFLQISPSDPRGLYEGMKFFLQVGTHEDCVSNVLQMIIIMISCILITIKAIRAKQWPLVTYIFCMFVGLLLIASIIAFTHHITRYQLALFVLSAPVVALLFNPTHKMKTILAWVLIFVLVVPSMEYAYNNNLRKLFSRKKATVFNTDRLSMYFRNDLSFKDPYIDSIEHIVSQGCDEVGLVMKFNYWDYPLWVIWENVFNQKGRMEHIYYLSEYAPKVYPLGQFQPCALVAVDYSSGSLLDKVEFNGRLYLKTFVTDKTIVYY